MMLAHACLTEVIQGQFKDTDYKLALIVFLHTHGRNGRYNPHLHVILAEGAFQPLKKEWKAFKHLPLAPLRRYWQKHLMALVMAEFGELNGVVNELWTDYPNGFYAYPGNHKKCRRSITKG